MVWGAAARPPSPANPVNYQYRCINQGGTMTWAEALAKLANGEAVFNFAWGGTSQADMYVDAQFASSDATPEEYPHVDDKGSRFKLILVDGETDQVSKDPWTPSPADEASRDWRVA